MHQNKKIDEASQEFVAWVDNVRKDALKEGVSEGVLNWALEDVKASKDSVVHRKTAPELKLTLDAYLKRSSCTPTKIWTLSVEAYVFLQSLRAVLTKFLIVDVENVNHRMVVDQRVSTGASRLKENSELLTEISQKFGVPSQFLVAIWGIETK